MNIETIFAHPDDCELWASGTLLKHIEKGDSVNCSIFYELNDTRLSESKEALNILGMSAKYFETLPYQKPNIENYIASTKNNIPDVIVTHWQNDTHIEHQNIFQFALLVAHHYKRYFKKTPILLMASTYYLNGVNNFFYPEILIDISETIEQKIESIKCHKSQKPDNLISDILTQNKIFGNMIKTDYAEGFIEYPLFGYGRTKKRSNFREFF